MEKIIFELHSISGSLVNLNYQLSQSSTTASDFHDVTGYLSEIVRHINKPEVFWNTQWFAAMIGAVAALVVTHFISFYSNRKKILREFYQTLAEKSHNVSLDSLLTMAMITRYGHTLTKDGKTTVIPEKPLGERIVIELRKRCKFWNLPMCLLRHNFYNYEKTLSKLPDLSRLELIETKEYKIAESCFEKITDVIEKKTGESSWTAR